MKLTRYETQCWRLMFVPKDDFESLASAEFHPLWSNPEILARRSAHRCEPLSNAFPRPFRGKYIVASNAVWYPFGKPDDFLRRENRPVFTCWGEPQIPHNAPLVRLLILRTLLFYAHRSCTFSLSVSSGSTPRIKLTLALTVKSSFISFRTRWYFAYAAFFSEMSFTYLPSGSALNR